MQTDLIIINDYCDRCHVDPSFIVELEEDGLINVQVIGEERYIPVSQLAELERYTHLYYDLSINVAGIDAPQGHTQAPGNEKQGCHCQNI